MKIKTSSIEIPERFRVNYGDLESLKKSIEKFGTIQPIVITYVNGKPILVAGCRRLLACLQLEIEEIEVIERKDLVPITRREIELEENIARKQFTWQEEVKAKAELLELRESQATPGIWSTKPRIAGELAEELGKTASELSQDIQLAKAIKEYPELELEESKTNAFKKYKKIVQSKALAVISAGLSGGENLWLYNGDCRKELEKVPSKSVSVCLTDPSWGVDVFNVQVKEEMFNDETEEAFKVLEETLPHLDRVLKDDSHAFFFFATRFYTRTFELLSKIFKVEPIPFVWYKNTGSNFNQKTKLNPNYETIFLCRKGSRQLFAPSNACMQFDVPVKKIHPTQKPIELIEHLINISTIPGEIILDPFAGSGVVGKVAIKLQRKAILIEESEELFNAMKVYINTKEEKKLEQKGEESE